MIPTDAAPGPDTSIEDAGPAPDPGAAGRSRRPRWEMPAAALVLGVAIGAGGVAAATDPTSSEEYQSLQQRLDAEEERAATARDDVRQAQNTAAAASRSAEQQSAELKVREQLVAEREAAVAVVEEQVAARSIGEGTWTIGVDVEPGTYRTSQAILGQCYWGIYRSGSNGSDIIDNDIVTGGFPTVQLREGQDFTNRDCGTFVKQ